jgi:hypothetical protein
LDVRGTLSVPKAPRKVSAVLLFVFVFFSRLNCGLLKSHRTPQQFCCLMPNTPEQYQSSSINAMSVSREKQRDYRFLLCAQETSYIKPKGDHLGRVQSDQMILWTVRRGRLVRSSCSSAETKSLKTKVNETVQLPPQ